MRIFIMILFVGLAFWFANPKEFLANFVWPDSAAPWEEVDAFYYPDAQDLQNVMVGKGVGSLDGCRDWVIEMAAKSGDSGLQRGDYECGVGKVESRHGLSVYRITAE